MIAPTILLALASAAVATSAGSAGSSSATYTTPVSLILDSFNIGAVSGEIVSSQMVIPASLDFGDLSTMSLADQAITTDSGPTASQVIESATAAAATTGSVTTSGAGNGLIVTDSSPSATGRASDVLGTSSATLSTPANATHATSNSAARAVPALGLVAVLALL